MSSSLPFRCLSATFAPRCKTAENLYRQRDIVPGYRELHTTQRITSERNSWGRGGRQSKAATSAGGGGSRGRVQSDQCQ